MPCNKGTVWSFRKLWLFNNSKRIKLLSSATSACLNFTLPSWLEKLEHTDSTPQIPHSTVVAQRKHKRQNCFQILRMSPSICLIRKMPGPGFLVWQQGMKISHEIQKQLQLCSQRMFVVPLVTVWPSVTNETCNAALPLCTLIVPLYWQLQIGQMPYDPEWLIQFIQ